MLVVQYGVSMKAFRVAIIGARGIGGHGGYETVVAELAPRLKERGHQVYCSTRSLEDAEFHSDFKGVQLMRFPFRFPEKYSISKTFELLYDSYFVVRCKIALKCDAVYCLGVVSGIALLATSFFGASTAVNIDGLEWTRGKFGRIVRFFLRLSFLASCLGSNRIVLDNQALIDYVPQRFRNKTVCITYGVSPVACSDSADIDFVLRNDGIINRSKGTYWLVVARLEPENNIHKIIHAYVLSKSTNPLVIIGDCSSPGYERNLLDLAADVGSEKRVILAGSVYDQEILRQLRCGCLAYIHGHSVGGTNPSLLEAMSAGNVIISHDNPFNREVCHDAAVYFRNASDLAEAMNAVENAPSRFHDLGRMASRLSEENHKWEEITTEYEQLLRTLTLI